MESQLQELNINECDDDECGKEDKKWGQLFYKEMCDMDDDELCQEAKKDEEGEVGWGGQRVDRQGGKCPKEQWISLSYRIIYTHSLTSLMISTILYVPPF